MSKPWAVRKQRPTNDELATLYLASGSIREMSRRLGVKNTTARRWLVDASIPIVPCKGGLAPGRKRRFRIHEIELACTQCGLSDVDIALIVNYLRGYGTL